MMGEILRFWLAGIVVGLGVGFIISAIVLPQPQGDVGCDYSGVISKNEHDFLLDVCHFQQKHLSDGLSVCNQKYGVLKQIANDMNRKLVGQTEVSLPSLSPMTYEIDASVWTPATNITHYDGSIHRRPALYMINRILLYNENKSPSRIGCGDIILEGELENWKEVS